MTDLHDVLADVGRAVRNAEAFDGQLDPDQLTRWVYTLRGAVKRFRELDAEWTDVLCAVAPHGQPAVYDGMVVEASMRSVRTQWDNDRLHREVLRFATYDPKTGEQRDADEAIAAVGELFPLTGTSIRVGAAKKLIPGFDPSEYCQTELKPSVRITEPGHTPGLGQ